LLDRAGNVIRKGYATGRQNAIEDGVCFTWSFAQQRGPVLLELSVESLDGSLEDGVSLLRLQVIA
jgi:hypothetical protein